MTKSKLHINRITKREEEIINLLMDGFSYKDIAQRLYISITTLKSHITNIFKKKQVNSLQQLLVKEYKKKPEFLNKQEKFKQIRKQIYCELIAEMQKKLNEADE